MGKPLSEEHRNYISPFITPEFNPNQDELETVNNTTEALLPQLGFYETAELSEASQAVLIAINEEPMIHRASKLPGLNMRLSANKWSTIPT